MRTVSGLTELSQKGALQLLRPVKLARRRGGARLTLILIALWSQPEPAIGQTPTSAAQPGAQPSPRPPLIRQPLYVPPADPRGLTDRPSVLDGGIDDAVSLYESTLELARCLQRSRPQRLAALLKKPVSSRAEELAVDRLLRFSGSCPGGRLRISARMLRGAAAEAILENFATPAPDRVKHLNSAQISDFASALPPVDRIRDRTSAEVQKVVECQVVLAPGLARKLITAAPGSHKADNAAEELIAATSRCGVLRPRAGRLQIAYRSYLAEALYHWTRATASHRLT